MPPPITIIKEGEDNDGDDGDIGDGDNTIETLAGRSISQAPFVWPLAQALTPPSASSLPHRRTKVIEDRRAHRPSSTILTLFPPATMTIVASSPSFKRKWNAIYRDCPSPDRKRSQALPLKKVAV